MMKIRLTISRFTWQNIESSKERPAVVLHRCQQQKWTNFPLLYYIKFASGLLLLSQFYWNSLSWASQSFVCEMKKNLWCARKLKNWLPSEFLSPFLYPVWQKHFWLDLCERDFSPGLEDNSWRLHRSQLPYWNFNYLHFGCRLPLAHACMDLNHFSHFVICRWSKLTRVSSLASHSR